MEVKDEKPKEESYGIDRSKFAIKEAGNDPEGGKYLKWLEGKEFYFTVKPNGIRETVKEHLKFGLDNKPVKDAQGNKIVDRKGPAIELDIDYVGEKKETLAPCKKIWEVSAKKAAAQIFSFLDTKNERGISFLFSKVFVGKRTGSGTSTTYMFYPIADRVIVPAK